MAVHSALLPRRTSSARGLAMNGVLASTAFVGVTAIGVRTGCASWHAVSEG